MKQALRRRPYARRDADGGGTAGEAWLVRAVWFDTGRRVRRPGSPRTGGWACGCRGGRWARGDGADGVWKRIERRGCGVDGVARCAGVDYGAGSRLKTPG